MRVVVNVNHTGRECTLYVTPCHLLPEDRRLFAANLADPGSWSESASRIRQGNVRDFVAAIHSFTWENLPVVQRLSIRTSVEGVYRVVLELKPGMSWHDYLWLTLLQLHWLTDEPYDPERQRDGRIILPPHQPKDEDEARQSAELLDWLHGNEAPSQA